MTLQCIDIARAWLGEPAFRAGHEFLYKCTRHGDEHPSLKINARKNVWLCGPCGASGNAWKLAAFLTGCDPNERQTITNWLREKGLLGDNEKSAGKIVATYDYPDERGIVLFQVLRYEPKAFRQRRPDGKGGWIWNLNGVRRVLYNLPAVIKAEEVIITEGEEDAGTGIRLGYVATTNSGGAKKWRAEYSEFLKGKRVTVIADADDAGREHGEQVALSVYGKAASLKLFEFPDAKDLTAWVEKHSKDCAVDLALMELIYRAPEWKPRAESASIQLGDTPASPPSWPNPPEPEPLASELPVVEPFSDQLLPPSLGPWVDDMAELMQVPPDAPAAIAVVCLAGSVNRRASIQPKAKDTSWIVIPNLWGGVVLPPGFLKSPVLRTMTKPLTRIEAEWRRNFELEMNRYERELVRAEIQESFWREECKRAIKKGMAEPTPPADKPQKPVQRRLVLCDSTYESLQEKMRDNLPGVLVVRDELTGWLSGLEREGRQGEREFFLTAWNGDSPYTIDRIGRGSIHVEHCCLSFIGGIQPARLRSYLVDALEDGPANDGLMQRFQLLVWPDTSGDWKLVDRPPDGVAEATAAKVFETLTELEAANPRQLRFSPDAQELFYEWLDELEHKLRGNDLHPAMVAHLSKYRSLMPSLALLFELADWAAGHGGGESVSLAHTQQAAAWCEYLESHARRVYSCVVSPAMRAARELAQKIKNRVLPEIFTSRDVYRSQWMALSTPDLVESAIGILEDAGWLRKIKADSQVQGRPRSARFQVNPRLLEKKK